ncbi:MAG: hypothetical protein Q8R90_03260 [Bacteroidales bacterium]|nr:hypothetical protein [Bacteroidales bacterium]
MKTFRILIVLFTITSLFGCKYKNEAKELEKQNQSLTLELAKSDSVSNVYLMIINDIESAFDSIIPAEKLSTSVPLGQQLRARFTNKMDEMNNQMLEHEKKYRSLSYRFAKSNATISEMSAKIEELNKVVKEKERLNSELAQTLNELENQNEEQAATIKSLVEQIKALDEIIESKTNSMNVAFYITGTQRELREKGIIEKSGGFLGFLGRVNTLNPNLDKKHLEQIDIREIPTFTLNAKIKDIEFITRHQPESYQLEESTDGTTTLFITDPSEFWRNSKYLVITY